ncbi:MAG TPA: PAS domain S-box protein, partial [Syntrophorhabdaceae bacterium]|nr:PAS domain S-box protein [Syntrophorhabdaceae bacterium]
MNVSDLWGRASLKSKLLAASIFVTCSILLTASAIFITIEVTSLRNSLKHDLMSYAKTTSMNLAAAITFDDKQSASETLEVLKTVPVIVAAVAYDQNGKVFASFSRGPEVAIPETSMMQGYHSDINYIYLIDAVSLDGEMIGSVYVCAELHSFYARVAKYALTLLAIMGVACALSYFLFARLHQRIMKPISHLTDLMHVVSEKQDYSVRALVESQDELGYLSGGFNEMLHRIDQRDRELAHYQTHLEEIVEERTLELRAANQKLENELSERLRMENELTESEHRYRTIFETTGNPSVIMAPDGTIMMVNSAFERVSGYKRTEVETRVNWRSLAFPDDVDKVETFQNTNFLASNSTPIEYECRLIDKEENVYYMVLTSSVIPGTDRIVTSMLDMTERKRLEEQLMQSQKMEAIGQLAGGVAHDFNNILTSIIGYGDLIRMKVSDDQKLMRYITPLLTSADKAKHLTQALLAFSRKQIISPKPIDLNTVIENVRSFIVRLIGEDVEMNVKLYGKELVVFADAGQIDQVLMNFATNARDA